MNDDRPASELDSEADREELKERYYNLMQELRVLLPGVQVLVAFLLTVPFAARFGELDDLGRSLFGVALVSGALAAVVFMTPTALHRFGARRDRAHRLELSIRLTRAGIVLFGLSLFSAVVVVTRYVFQGTPAVLASGAVGVAIVALWVVLPLRTRHDGRT